MEIDKQLFLDEIKGFKMSESHFELGSNIHIRDYYYAKRLFYNSFYTNRFAFLVTRFILKKFSDLIKTKSQLKTGQITLLGYENYSDMLVSNVRKMLNDYISHVGQSKRELFNHEVFTKDGFFLKNPGKVSSDIILIFPISTTFSTSLKIQNEIRDALSENLSLKLIFHNPIINCLVISNEPLIKDKTYFKDNDIEHAFGWRELHADEHIVDIDFIDREKATGEKKIIQQKYFVDLNTSWSKINECVLCYPKDPYQEKCLIETKASSVTPNLIFGYPKTAREKDENIFEFFNFKDNNPASEAIVYRRHFKKFDNHYIYFIRVGRLLQDYGDRIKQWLINLAKNELNSLIDSNIVIVTPTVGSNAGFVNLVNDTLFSDTATIIQYSPSEEYLQNFKLFYSDVIYNAEYVIFVDDVLSTTKTVSDINFYIQNVRKDKKGIDYALNIIDRVGYFNRLKLRDKIGRHKNVQSTSCLSFLQVNVPPIAHRDKYPFVSLVEKFHELSDKSVLDSMRLHFKRSEASFMPMDLNKVHEVLKDFGTLRSLLEFLANHEFLRAFQVTGDGKKYIYSSLIDAAFVKSTAMSYDYIIGFFRQKANSNAVISLINTYPEFKHEIKHILYKICTSDPFIRYHGIKKAAFQWVLSDLISLVRQINLQEILQESFFHSISEGEPSAYAPYHRFLFLLKRAAKLKINFIYSLETLTAMASVLAGVRKYKQISYFRYSNQTDLFSTGKKLIPDLRRVETLSPMDLTIYYVALLQELIIEHESKALEVVKNIKRVIDANISNGGNQKTLKNCYNDDYIHLLRMLVLENTFIFHSSSDKILSKLDCRVTFADVNYEAFMKRIADLQVAYPFIYNRSMLSRFDKDYEVNGETEDLSVRAFNNMLLLKALLKQDSESVETASKITIQKKLQRILQICCDILDIKDGGAFFAIKYKGPNDSQAREDNITVVEEYSNKETEGLRPEYFSSESFLFKLFDNKARQEEEQSSFELTFDQNGMFHYRGSDTLTPQSTVDFSEFHGKLYGNIFYLKISEFEDPLKGISLSPLAVIGFYNNALSDEMCLKFADRVQELKQRSNESLFPQSSERNIYKRFEPKQLRQLLLLRSDLSKFIIHHFENDSLRAYIDIINSNKYALSLGHGTKVYEEAVEDCISQILSISSLKDLKEKGINLRTAVQFLLNKVHLLSYAKKSLLPWTEETKDTFDTRSLRDIVDDFEEMSKYVFLLEIPELNRIADIQQIEFDSSTIQEQQLDLRFYIEKPIYKEMIFEILFNIRQHTIHEQTEFEFASRKIRLELTIHQNNKGDFLCVSNNWAQSTTEYISQISNRLEYKKGIDGLNLIYNILDQMYGLKLFLEVNEDLFKVYIPLKFKS